MTGGPLRFLAAGYGLAAIAAAALFGLSFAALALFWLGGAVATLAVGAAWTWLRPAADADSVSAERAFAEQDEALAAAVAAWEADRFGDVAQPPQTGAARA